MLSPVGSGGAGDATDAASALVAAAAGGRTPLGSPDGAPQYSPDASPSATPAPGSAAADLSASPSPGSGAEDQLVAISQLPAAMWDPQLDGHEIVPLLELRLQLVALRDESDVQYVAIALFTVFGTRRAVRPVPASVLLRLATGNNNGACGGGVPTLAPTACLPPPGSHAVRLLLSSRRRSFGLEAVPDRRLASRPV